MAKFLKRRINDAELVRLGGAYDGVITAVVEETVRNRFTAQSELVPVLVFDDGWTWIPNMGARLALIAMFGTTDTDAWVGCRISVFRQRVERVNKATGEAKVLFVKTVKRVDAVPVRADYDDTPDAPGLSSVADIFGKKRRA